MKKYIPVLVCLMFLSHSCIKGQGKHEVVMNEKIDPKIRTTISGLNKQVYTIMVENNFASLQNMFTDSLRPIINNNFSESFMPSMQRIMKGNPYRVYDEFHIKNTKNGDTIHLTSEKADETYTIKAIAKAPESYLTMLVSGDSLNEVMLTLLYSNIEGKWQISGITGEDYSLRGKNAIQLYNYSQALQKNNYMMDAINIMGMSDHCLKPGGNIFEFKKNKEIKQYSDSLTSRVKRKYPFPYTVNEVATKPLIVNIHYQLEYNEFIPMIVYQTVINVLDTVSLKQENDQMQKNIGKIFYGMDKNNRHLFYRAYNELPNGQNNPFYHGYLQTF